MQRSAAKEKSDADPNAQNSDGYNSLMFAAQSQNLELAELLLLLQDQSAIQGCELRLAWL